MSHVFLKVQSGGHAVERITDGVAALGVISWLFPWVHDWLVSVNVWVGLVIPPVSLCWLLTQLWKYWGRGK